MKSIKRFFQFHDWLWSVVLGFLAYWLLNWGPPSIGGVAMTYYAVNWVQALIATGAIMAGLMVIVRLGLFFYFKVLHKFIWGGRFKDYGSQPRKESTFRIPSKVDFYKGITPWQRLLFVFFAVAGLFAAALIVFLKLLSLAGSAPM